MRHQLQGYTEFQGLKIAIENKKGSTRSGIDPDGNQWKTKLTFPYGYIQKTEGTDGDEVDCFLGENQESQKVFVIHTQNPETGKYDEDKVMLGFDSEQHARDAFNQNYDSPCHIHNITTMDINQLKEKLAKREGKMLKSVQNLKEFFKGIKIKDLATMDIFAQNQDTDVFTGKTVTKDGKTYTLQTSKKDPRKRRYMAAEDQQDMFGTPEPKPQVEPTPKADKKKVQLFNNQIDLFGAGEEKPTIPTQENKPEQEKEDAPEPTPKPEKKPKSSGGGGGRSKKPKAAQEEKPKEDIQPVRGKKTREKLNEQVTELLATKKDGEFTDEDKQLLLQYTGRGGLDLAVDDISLNEFYTLPFVTRNMWEALKNLGFKGGRVLEPSSGTGNFISTAPENALITGVEMDEVSGRISNILYGDHNDIRIQTFEQFNETTEGGEFDAVIGNCPFGTRGASVQNDTPYRDIKKHEEYFVQRGIDDLKEGGLMAMIVPTSIMDNAQLNTYRLKINKQAEFLGAVRLPDGAFKHANAAVTSDILYFRKRPQEVIDRMNNLKEGELDQLFDELILDSEFITGTYFEKNPQYALGEQTTGQYGNKVWKGKLDENQLRETLDMLKPEPDDYSKVFGEGYDKEIPTYTPQVGDIKVINGRTYRFNENHRWERVQEEDEAIEDVPEELKALGIENLGQLQQLIADPAQLWNLDPKLLAIIGDRFTNRISREILSYSAEAPHRAEIYKKLIVLGLTIKDFQKQIQSGTLETSEAQRLSAKIQGMLKEITEAYGNPHELGLRKLLGKTKENPFLYVLAMITQEGQIHRILEDPLAFYSVYHPNGEIGKFDETNLLSIVQYLFDNELPASLDMIAQHYSEDSGNLEKHLLAADDIYIDEKGNFAPVNEICMGEVFDRLDAWESMRTDNLKKLEEGKIEDSEKEILVARNEKLSKQILELRRRAGMKDLDSLPVLMRDVNIGLFSVDLLNDYLSQRLGANFMSEIVFDEKNNIFTCKGGIENEAYLLYASKGALEKDEKDRLANLIKKYFGDQINPYQFLVLNHLNKLTNTLKGEANERFNREIVEIEEGFREYLKVHDQATEITENYNRRYNGYIQKKYDSSPIEGIKTFDYERVIAKDAEGNPVIARDKAGDHTWETVRRMYEQGKGMIAHGVGLGKTLEGILLALLHKQTGRAKRPMVVCPKSVLKNWYDEVNKWTTGTKVLVIGLKQDDKGKWTEETSSEIKLKLMNLQSKKEDDWDLILISRDNFSRIDFTEQNKEKIINEIVANNYPVGADTNKKIAKKRNDAVQNLIKSLNPVRPNAKTKVSEPYVYENIYFENLGVDMMIRDEAHDTKNLLVPTLTKDIVGLSSSDAARSMHNFVASKVLRSQNNEKGYYALTATPISNSPLEVMNMLLPFSEVELTKMGVKNMDEFIAKFASIAEVPVTDTDTKVKMKNKFAGWTAPDALRNLFFRFVDYRTKDTVESVKANIKFPKEKLNRVTSNLNEGQKELMKDCLNRLYVIKYRKWNGEGFELNEEKINEHVMAGLLSEEEVAEFSGYFHSVWNPKFEELNAGLDPAAGDKLNIDVYFKVQTDMMKIAAELDWYKEKCTDYATPINDDFVKKHGATEKLGQVTQTVAALHKEGKKQIVFAINKSLHETLRQQFIKSGIPESEICIVNADTTKNSIKRKEVSDAYNAGKYKVIIGNYSTMGEGLNFNYMTSDIHHLQPTWNYLQIEQGNGRGIRQGNPLDIVNTHYYLSKGSIDSFVLNKILDKGGMADKFMKGEISTWDDEIQADGDELIIELSGNPEQARLLKEAKNQALEAAMKAKNRTSAMRDFQKLFESKMQLAKMEAGSPQQKLIEKEIETITNRLNENTEFEHSQYLDLKEMPIILADKGAVVPVGSVVKYGYKDTDLAVIKSYTPSTGRIVMQVYSETNAPELKTLMLNDFRNQYGNDEKGTIYKQDFDAAELMRKYIIDNKTANDEFIYSLPQDTFKQYRKEIISNIRAAAKYNSSCFMWKDMDGKYHIEEAEDAFAKIDNEGGKIIFPQEEPDFPKILQSMIDRTNEYTKAGEYVNTYDLRTVAQNVYGSNYEKEIKKALKKLKGEVIGEETDFYPTSGRELLSMLDGWVNEGYIDRKKKTDILGNLERDWTGSLGNVLQARFLKDRNAEYKWDNGSYQSSYDFPKDYFPSEDDWKAAAHIDRLTGEEGRKNNVTNWLKNHVIKNSTSKESEA